MRTLARNGHTAIVVQRSRFIASLARVDSPTAAAAFIAQTRQRHHAASHHATAWILGPRGDNRRGNDDGEPSGTAAAPMLAVLSGNDLTDTVAVVSRYFGGTKLGTGGLARAYAHAVTTALSHLGCVDIRSAHTITVSLDHADAARVEAELRATGHTVTGTDYDTRAHLHLTVTDPGTVRDLLARRAAGAHLTVTGTTTVTEA